MVITMTIIFSLIQFLNVNNNMYDFVVISILPEHVGLLILNVLLYILLCTVKEYVP
jgi:hypothetical protein